MIAENKSLLKVEMEGNMLENGTAAEFAKVLRVNKTLRVLDLENNNLTNSGQTKEEVKDIAAALDENVTLLSLNLANNNMEETIGNEFVIYTERNKTLINFEFSDFILPQVLEIQKNLRRNKAAYDAERLREWRERKRMAEEEELMRV
jgi:Ran GTPase-activating protein (RanGAP) involved in mRNA processing and transport